MVCPTFEDQIALYQCKAIQKLLMGIIGPIDYTTGTYRNLKRNRTNSIRQSKTLPSYYLSWRDK